MCQYNYIVLISSSITNLKGICHPVTRLQTYILFLKISSFQNTLVSNNGMAFYWLKQYLCILCFSWLVSQSADCWAMLAFVHLFCLLLLRVFVLIQVCIARKQFKHSCCCFLTSVSFHRSLVIFQSQYLLNRSRKFLPVRIIQRYWDHVTQCP